MDKKILLLFIFFFLCTFAELKIIRDMEAIQGYIFIKSLLCSQSIKYCHKVYIALICSIYMPIIACVQTLSCMELLISFEKWGRDIVKHVQHLFLQPWNVWRLCKTNLGCFVFVIQRV
jgi:hypothetical protein